MKKHGNPDRLYLSRSAGAKPEGPFSPVQIRAMWKAGGMTQDAQVIAHGSDQWKSIGVWLAERKSHQVGVWLILVALAIAAAVGLWACHDMVERQREILRDAASSEPPIRH